MEYSIAPRVQSVGAEKKRAEGDVAVTGSGRRRSDVSKLGCRDKSREMGIET